MTQTLSILYASTFIETTSYFANFHELESNYPVISCDLSLISTLKLNIKYIYLEKESLSNLLTFPWSIDFRSLSNQIKVRKDLQVDALRLDPILEVSTRLSIQTSRNYAKISMQRIVPNQVPFPPSIRLNNTLHSGMSIQWQNALIICITQALEMSFSKFTTYKIQTSTYDTTRERRKDCIPNGSHNCGIPQTARLSSISQKVLVQNPPLLPDLTVLVNSAINCHLQKQKKASSRRKYGQVFPIIQLHLHEPISLHQVIQEEKKVCISSQEAMINIQNQYVQRNPLFSKYSTFSKIHEGNSAMHSIQQSSKLLMPPQWKIYRLNYRFSHKFSLHFKKLKLRVTHDVTFSQFTQIFLDQICKGEERYQKKVYVEKQRDLVPLISLDQLFLRHPNFLQVRALVCKAKVVQKPILLKKRNQPSFGITKLVMNIQYDNQQQ